MRRSGWGSRRVAKGVAWAAAACLWAVCDAAVVRGPYLQQGTPTGIVVRWRTDNVTNSRVLYGAQPGSLTSSTVVPTPTIEHVVTLSGLSPGTRYYYAVGSSTQIQAGGDLEHFFVTSPPSGTPAPVRIWVLGDSGTGDSYARAVRDAYLSFTGQRHTDLWVMLGDNAYPSGTDADYQTTLFDIYPMMLRRSVLWPSLGNHDAMSADSGTQSGPYYAIFTLPTAGQAGGLPSGTEAYYSFDFANIHFVVLDSMDTDRSPGGAMLTWLDQDLGATLQDWVIAIWHHPPYSKGSHDSDQDIELIEMRQNAVPILEAHGVDLSLTGHSHSYERSFLLDGHYGDSTTFDPSMELDGGDGRIGGNGPYVKADLGSTPHSGAVYAVAGSSGQVGGGTLDHPAMFLSLNVHGSLVLDVQGARLDARFLDRWGTVRDSFTIIKGCGDKGTFTSMNASGTDGSAVLTPGYCDAGPPCASDIGSSVSSSFRGAFWMLGAGDPRIGNGIDSGALPALDGASAGWVRFDATKPAYLRGDWVSDERVDGCISDAPAPHCMGMLLGDQRAGAGYFAMLSDPPGSQGEFSLVQPGQAAINLAAVPRPSLTGTVTVNPYTLSVSSVVGAVPPEGLYLDTAECPADVVLGYKIYEQQTYRWGAAPVDRTRDDGSPYTGWELAPGGAGPGGAPLPIGTTAAVTLTCYTATDFFLAASLVFDSGFETPFVSLNSARILCGDCAADADLDGSCRTMASGAPGPDCDDSNPDVWPGAPQLCDGLNNDCNDPSWPGLEGTNESDDDGDGIEECSGDCNDADANLWAFAGEVGTMLFPTDTETLTWSAVTQTGGSGIVLVYDTLRSSAPGGFATASCLESDDGHDTAALDTAIPAPKSVFFYLVRAQNSCGPGSLGTGTGGLPRSGPACP